MTDRAMRALWVGIVAIVLMGVFPPWFESGGATFGNIVYTKFYSRGYGFLFDPPTNNAGQSTGAFIDLSRLVVQWVLVAAITLGFVLTFNRTPMGKRPEEPEPPPGQEHQGP